MLPWVQLIWLSAQLRNLPPTSVVRPEVYHHQGYCLDSALRAQGFVLCRMAGNTRMCVCCRDGLGQAKSVGSSSLLGFCYPVNLPRFRLVPRYAL